MGGEKSVQVRINCSIMESVRKQLPDYAQKPDRFVVEVALGRFLYDREKKRR